MVKEGLTASGAPIPEGRRVSGSPSSCASTHIIWREAARRGLTLSRPETWRRLDGGRANDVWYTLAGDRPVIVKRVRTGRSSTLFPNDAGREVAMLQALASHDIAPTLIDHWQGEAGPIIVMTQVEGETVANSLAEAPLETVAKALDGLHRMPITPFSALIRRRRTGSAVEILAEAEAFLAHWPMGKKSYATKMRRALEALAPVGNLPASPRLSLLHGDPVPANLVLRRGRIIFLDWQCPAIGDPVEDIALFLSPAMQSLYGAGPLEEEAKESFLAALPAESAARWRRAAPFHAYRMAAYCGWCVLAGEADYLAGFEAELAELARHRERAATR